MLNERKISFIPESKVLRQLLLATLPSSSGSIDPASVRTTLPQSDDRTPILIKVEGGKCSFQATTSGTSGGSDAWKKANSASLNVLLIYIEKTKTWQICGRKEGEIKAETQEVILESYLGRWLKDRDLSGVIGHIEERELMDRVLLYLDRTKIFLNSSDCAVSLVKLNGDDCDRCFRALVFPTAGDPAKLLVSEQLPIGISDRIPLIISSVKQVMAVSEEVSAVKAQGKLHQAFTLLLTGASCDDYQSVYSSKLVADRRGVTGLCLDLIDLALAADLEFGLVFFAVRTILEATECSAFTKGILSPKVFGLSGAIHWWHEDFVINRDMKLIKYLSSLEADDITEENILAIAAIAFSLLCQDTTLERSKCAAFRLFDTEKNIKLCFDSAGFRDLFNRVMSRTLKNCDEAGATYPRVIFLFIKYAYTTAYFQNLIGHESILCQILRDGTKCLEFSTVFQKLCENIVTKGFQVAAKAALNAKESLKGSLTLPSKTEDQLKAVAAGKSVGTIPVVSDAISSAGLFSPQRPKRKMETAKAVQGVMKDVIEAMSSYLPTVSSASKVSVSAEITTLCERTVGQCSSEAEQSMLEKEVADVSRIPDGLQLQAVPGDGHCLYRAVSYYLGMGGDVGSLRAVVADRVQHDMERYRGFIELPEGKTVKQYIKDIRGTNQWAGDLEINALMRILERPIVVIGPDGDIRNERQTARFSGEPIFVRFNDRDHYDALILSGTRTSREILSDLTRLPPERRRIARQTKALKSLVASGDPIDLPPVWENIVSRLQRPIFVTDSTEVGPCVRARCSDHLVKTDSKIEEDISRINSMAADKRRPLVVIIDGVMHEAAPTEAEVSRLEQLIKGCGSSAFIAWSTGGTPLYHPSYRGLYSSIKRFPEPFYVFLVGKSDLCQEWLKRTAEELTKRLEQGINVTQSFLMLTLDCFFSLSSEFKQRAARDFLKMLTPESRTEMVNRILDIIACSTSYGQLVRRDEPEVVRRLSFSSSSKR